MRKRTPSIEPPQNASRPAAGQTKAQADGGLALCHPALAGADPLAGHRGGGGLAAGLTGAGNLYTQSAVWSGHFTAANGRFYDASHLYQNRRRPLYLSGELQLFGLALPGRAASQAAEQAGGRAAGGGFWNGPFNLILPFTYDNGFDSAGNSPPARA